MSDDEDRAGALSELAPHLPTDLLGPALQAAREISDDEDRAQALGALAPRLWRLDDTKFAELEGEIRVASLLEGLARGGALSLLAAAVDQIAALGGEVATSDCRIAISDTARWWP